MPLLSLWFAEYKLLMESRGPPPLTDKMSIMMMLMKCKRIRNVVSFIYHHRFICAERQEKSLSVHF